MGQLGFFDADKRLEALSARGDPLEAIDRLVPWESFRAEIEAVVLTPDELKKSSAGRKPFDAILMFRMLVLQALNNLSDEQVEYQVRDRLSFSRFLGLAIEDSIPDATTLWLFREKLARAGLIEQLFDRFDQHLAAKGYMARGGQIIDASIVPVPADLRRLGARRAVIDRCKSQKPTGLGAVFRLPRQTAQMRRTKISAQWYRSRHDEPPWFAMLNQTRAHRGIARESQFQGPGINRYLKRSSGRFAASSLTTARQMQSHRRQTPRATVACPPS